MADSESRTEAATPARLIKARSEGQAPVSREVPVLAGLGAGVGVLAMLGPISATRLCSDLASIIRHSADVRSSADVAIAITGAFRAGLMVVGPVSAAIAVSTIVAGLLQTGFQIRGTAIRLHFERLSPLSGLGSLFSAGHAAEAGKSLAKLGVLGSIIGIYLSSRLAHRLDLMSIGLTALPGAIAGAMVAVAVAALLTQGGAAILDFGWGQTQFAARLRMSHAEVRDETKETDGNPEIKARFRAIRLLRVRQNLKSAMARASVVVTNPTHYAVALHYQPGQESAPQIVAKGSDLMAARIREMARRHAIPVVANPPLARALFRLDVDTEITPEHYRAVAEIIAYVWRLTGKNDRKEAVN